MSLLKTVTTGQEQKPPIILLYGLEGIGKTTIGAKADNVIFIRTEDGKGTLDFASFPKANTMQEAFDQLEALCAEEHEYKTLSIDSVDWMQVLIWQHVAKTMGQPNIEAIGYGTGYKMALQHWEEYLNYITFLRDHKNMTIYQIAHSEVKKFKDPELEAYDVYSLKLHEKATSLLKEHADCVFFMKYETFQKKTKGGFGQEDVKAVGGENRVIYTQNKASAHAKNRYGIEPVIKVDNPDDFWAMIKHYVPFFKTNEGEQKYGTITTTIQR